MNIAGIDISEYAIENAILETKPYLIQRSCEVLPWDSNSFDLVYSKETLPHLTKKQLGLTISEIERVAKGNNIFLEIGVSESDRGKEMMKAWDKTHQTIRSSDWWRGFLKELNFRGQVNFKILF